MFSQQILRDGTYVAHKSGNRKKTLRFWERPGRQVWYREMRMGRVESSEATTGNEGTRRSGGGNVQGDTAKSGPFAWKEGVFPEDYMHLRLREEISRAGRYRHYLSLMLIDFVPSEGEGPGEITEQRHQQGKQIRSILRSTDVVFMMKNGSISVILPETTERESQYVMDRLRVDIRSQMPLAFGVASYPHDAGHEASLVQHARERLSRNQSGIQT